MKSEQKRQIGARLREKREGAGYTREALGELCGLSPRFLANVEMGDATFSLESLTRVCQVLCCSSDALLFGREPGGGDELCRRVGQVEPAFRPALEKVLQGFFEAVARAAGPR